MAQIPPKIFTDLTPKEIAENLATKGHGIFRAKILAKYVYREGQNQFDHLPSLAKEFRRDLPTLFTFPELKLMQRKQASDGTEKFLFQLADGLFIESVLIPDVGKKKGKASLCLSSQAGCAMGCTFCLTSFEGLKRNLQTWEIIEQYRAIARFSRNPITHLVFMGMGEPLHNFENVMRAIEIFTAPEGIGLSEKKITVSTSGLIPAIKKFTLRSKALLAVSLNAPNDAIRNQIMPINKTHPMKKLLLTLAEIPTTKKDRVFLEYVLLKDINDQPEHAEELVEKLEAVKNIKINLIPYNPNAISPYQRPAPETVFQFLQVLKNAGFSISIRQTRGDDSFAACGQLTGARAFTPAVV